MDASPNRGRMKLSLESIEVSSFPTDAGEPGVRGTVKAHHTGPDDSHCGPCGASYPYPCNTMQWEQTCHTCAFTCSYACQSYAGYASCGGSCDYTNCPGQGDCTSICGPSV